MSEINSTRVCSLCRKEKNLGEFYNSKRSKDGKWIYCKDCAREYRENHKQTNTKIGLSEQKEKNFPKDANT